MGLKATRSVPASGPVLERHRGRDADVMGMSVRRIVPLARRRTVGAWCFLDHFGPATVPAGRRGLDIGPHPHCGLATVTWLLSGELVHRDSLGSVQRIRPGQLNWMVAGHGISHAEEGVEVSDDTQMHGVQMWVALPEATRHLPATFEHHPALPSVQVGALRVQVMVGELAGSRSPARCDTPLFGFDVAVPADSHPLPLDPDLESAVVVLSGAVEVEGVVIEPGTLAYLGTRRHEVQLTGHPTARLLVLGGAPLDEPLLLGWNFVVRDAAELRDAYRSWADDDGRFGKVPGARGARIDAPGSAVRRD